VNNKELYLKLTNVHPEIGIYNQPWWLDAVCGDNNWDVVFSYDKNEKIQGSMTYYIKEQYGIKYITRPPLTQHNGIWLNIPEGCKYQSRLAYEHKIMSDLIDKIEELGFACYMQAQSPDITNWLPFYWRGYSQSTAYTYRIEETREGDYEKIFSGYGKVVRKNINKTKPLAIIEESDDMELFRTMQSKTFKRQGLEQMYSLELLNRLNDACLAHEASTMLVAKDEEGNIHCVSYFIYDKNWVYQLMSGSDPAFRKSEFKTLCIDHAIQFACNTRRGFDFEGSMLPGVEEYFRKFNAVQTPYFHLKKIYTKNPIVKMAIIRKMQY
jgi:hypothetical protein